MSRSYYNSGAPFLYSGSEPVGPGMDCLQLRQPTGPFHYLISEQAKSLVALQELQNEVGALLEFRDLVMETFPNLRSKLAASSPATMTSSSHTPSNIPVSIRPGDWTPGRVRKKLTSKEEARSASSKKGGDIAVQDSGFSTEASSKETHSASSTAPPVSAAASGETDEVEDELWNLLDLIHRKGTRLKDEVEALQGSIRDQGIQEESNFQRALFHASADDVRQLRHERDLLLDRLAEMEAEVLAGRVHTTRLQEDLENLLSAKHDLEEQLKAVVSQRGEVNSRIHDLHLQFVAKSASTSPDGVEKKALGDIKDLTSSHRTVNNISANSDVSGSVRKSSLDSVLGDKVFKVQVPESKKFAAILKEHDPLILQKHLLKTTVHNQVLQEKLDSAVDLEMGLRTKLDKAREENEELKFQLEDKSIQLEGTRARMRVLESSFSKPLTNSTSPDIIPALDSSASDHHRSEITTASMKAMIPLNMQLDHSSSTESAHDQAENNRQSADTKRRPSKIPLKSYTAPKPPNGGKYSPAPGARSRSGDSPHRPHSAQSWRNRSEGSSLTALNKSNTTPLPKSRNSSLLSTRDSLSSKLRSSDSLTKLSPNGASGNSFGNSSGGGRGGTLKKSNNQASNKDNNTTEKRHENSPERKYQYQWILSSYKSDCFADENFPDSLDKTNESIQNTATENSNNSNSQSQRYQTANTFVWTVGGNGIRNGSSNNNNNQKQNQFYDSIDSNLASSLYQANGEELAECDSLEKQLSGVSFEK